jgi:hypothetical protein
MSSMLVAVENDEPNNEAKSVEIAWVNIYK